MKFKLLIAVALGLLAWSGSAVASSRPSVFPAPTMTGLFVAAPSSTSAVVVVDAFAPSTSRPDAYVAYGYVHLPDDSASPQFGREIGPDIWWFHWQLPALTTGDIADGNSGSDLASGAGQASGPLVRRYVIAVYALSNCNQPGCIALPSWQSNMLVQKGTFPNGI